MDRYEELNRLADVCTELGQLLRYAASGDVNAAQRVMNHVDAYWHGIVVGTGKIESLLAPLIEPESDDDAEIDLHAGPSRRSL